MLVNTAQCFHVLVSGYACKHASQQTKKTKYGRVHWSNPIYNNVQLNLKPKSALCPVNPKTQCHNVSDNSSLTKTHKQTQSYMLYL